jgi:fucose 4-O-acetylase-like acetyltransferase
MPLMAFLSGTLVSQSLAKGPRTYLFGKIRNILYPYVLWTFIFTALWIAASPFTGTSHHYKEFFWNFIDPPGHLWFIYYIFVFYCLMLVLRDTSRMATIALSLMTGAVCTVLQWPDWERFFFLFAFFVMGQHATANAAAFAGLLRRPLVRAGMMAAAVGLPLTALLTETTIRYEPASLPLAVAGIGLMLVFAASVGDRPGVAIFRHLGRHSLPAYVLHWMIIAVIALTLTRGLRIADPRIVIVFAAVGGFAGTLSAVWAIRRFRLGALFAWPADGGRRLATAFGRGRQRSSSSRS